MSKNRNLISYMPNRRMQLAKCLFCGLQLYYIRKIAVICVVLVVAFKNKR